MSDAPPHAAAAPPAAATTHAGDMTFTPRELLARGPHRMPTPLGRPPRVLQSVKIISSGFASVLDGILAEASFRCTSRQSHTTQPFPPPRSHHMPDKIVCQQLPVQPGTYEYKLKLEIVHTAVTMMATIAGTPNDLLELIPTRLVELRPGEPSHRTLQMIRPPTDMAGHGHVAVNVNSTASSARDAELLLAIDAFFVEGSHRCIVRAASGSTQPIAPRQPQHHQPHQVCLEAVTDQSTRIHLRHTNVTLSVLLAATVDEIARFVPQSLLHVHQVNLELRPVPPAILDKIKRSVVRFRDLDDRADSHPDGVMCAVCHGVVQADEEVAEIVCGHIFHKDCVIPWFEKRSTCPLCRASIVKQPKVAPAAAAADMQTEDSPTAGPVGGITVGGGAADLRFPHVPAGPESAAQAAASTNQMADEQRLVDEID